MTTPAALGDPLLAAGRMYLAYDRFVCARIDCAGTTAAYTGYTIGGHPVTPITDADIAEWVAHGLGPLVCECGHLTIHPNNQEQP